MKITLFMLKILVNECLLCFREIFLLSAFESLMFYGAYKIQKRENQS